MYLESLSQKSVLCTVLRGTQVSSSAAVVPLVGAPPFPSVLLVDRSWTFQSDISIRHSNHTFQSDISIRYFNQTFQSDIAIRHFNQTYQSDIPIRHCNPTFQTFRTHIAIRHSNQTFQFQSDISIRQQIMKTAKI